MRKSAWLIVLIFTLFNLEFNHGKDTHVFFYFFQRPLVVGRFICFVWFRRNGTARGLVLRAA